MAVFVYYWIIFRIPEIQQQKNNHFKRFNNLICFDYILIVIRQLAQQFDLVFLLKIRGYLNPIRLLNFLLWVYIFSLFNKHSHFQNKFFFLSRTIFYRRFYISSNFNLFS